MMDTAFKFLLGGLILSNVLLILFLIATLTTQERYGDDMIDKLHARHNLENERQGEQIGKLKAEIERLHIANARLRNALGVQEMDKPEVSD